jgi:hypothetical protein
LRDVRNHGARAILARAPIVVDLGVAGERAARKIGKAALLATKSPHFGFGEAGLTVYVKYHINSAVCGAIR